MRIITRRRMRDLLIPQGVEYLCRRPRPPRILDASRVALPRAIGRAVAIMAHEELDDHDTKRCDEETG